MDKIRITWLGHSCFKLSAEGYDIVIDPYEDNSVAGLAPINASADKVLCSHSHRDHGAAHVVKLNVGEKKTPFQIEQFDSYHDDAEGTIRGKNIIYKISCGHVTVVHLGDIGCIPADDIVSSIKNPDAVMIPVGGYYTVGAETAKEIADILDAKIVIPMHYRSVRFGAPVLSELENFTKLCGNAVYYDDNFIDISKETSPQTAVLSYTS